VRQDSDSLIEDHRINIIEWIKLVEILNFEEWCGDVIKDPYDERERERDKERQW
jgi:hypothetical protein